MPEQEFECECIKCGYEESSTEHCKDITCPECGGTMRRTSRPGPGQDDQDGGNKMENENEIKENEKVDVPNNIKNGEFVIEINGEIGGDITFNSIKEQLERANGKDVVLEVASPGGSVFEGVDIFNAIRDYQGNTETRIKGMAASMASYISLAADKVLAEDNATFMIHNAWGFAMGNSEDMKAEAELLESINKLIAQEYIKKTGISEEKVLKMMSDETWLFGSEIKESGFVDDIIVHEGKEEYDKDKSVAEAKNTFKSSLLKTRSSLSKIKKAINSKSDLDKKIVSKFSDDAITKLNSIIKTLKGKAEDKKPEDKIELDVKSIELLIEDLEAIAEESKPVEEESEVKPTEEEKPTEEKPTEEPAKETEIEEKTEEEKPKEEEKSEEKKEEEPEEEKSDEKEKKTEEESKFQELQELIGVCEGYQSEIKTKDKIISKFEDKVKVLEGDNKKLGQEISKFKQEVKEKLVAETASKISKFKNLSKHEEVILKQKYSKMSESALREIGRITEDQMLSKLEEPKTTTKPSDHLEPVEKTSQEEEDFSKMSKDEKLDYLADKATRRREGMIE